MSVKIELPIATASSMLPMTGIKGATVVMVANFPIVMASRVLPVTVNFPILMSLIVLPVIGVA